MTTIFRAILIDLNTNLPVVGDDIGDKLGVRVPADVETYFSNGADWVSPLNTKGEPQGTSVSPDTGCNLPVHRRPKPPSAWNGTNNKAALRVWQMDTAQLQPNELVYVPDPDDATHGFLSPPVAMPLAQYRGYVHATARMWALSPDPAPACVNLPVQGADVSDHEERAALVDATAAGGDVEALVAELRTANASGVSRTDLIAELTAGVERAPDEAAADVLLELLDRVTGFCGPHARIDLAD